MALAKQAMKAQAKLKVMAWGESGAGKSRFALSFPGPLVADLEKSTTLYAGEFDFLVAEPTPLYTPARLVMALVDELEKGEYPQVQTLVIDPFTDFQDDLEKLLIADLAKRGTNLDSLNGLKKAQAYSQVNEGFRERLDRLLRLPLHVIFVTRAKNIWAPVEGKMQPVGKTYDAKEIVESLCDVVLQIQKGGKAAVRKSRLGDLPEEIASPNYWMLLQALEASRLHDKPIVFSDQELKQIHALEMAEAYGSEALPFEPAPERPKPRPAAGQRAGA